jgi:hypothetical protein
MTSMSEDTPLNLKTAFFLTPGSRIAVDVIRADGTGARFEGGAPHAAEVIVAVPQRISAAETRWNAVASR